MANSIWIGYFGAGIPYSYDGSTTTITGNWAVTGQFYAPVSATIPGYSFTGDTNTGYGASAADTLALFAGGTTPRVTVTAAALASTLPILPSSDNAIDLGSASFRWNEAFTVKIYTEQFEFTAKNKLESPANGLLNTSNNNEGFGIQFNTGTAAPTFNNGTVTAGSRNVCGEVTLTGGNTAGTVTFGLPNWTNTPFVVLSEGQGTNTAIVSAVSATAFSFTGATANGVVRWVSVGRI